MPEVNTFSDKNSKMERSNTKNVQKSGGPSGGKGNVMFFVCVKDRMSKSMNRLKERIRETDRFFIDFINFITLRDYDIWTASSRTRVRRAGGLWSDCGQVF